MKLSVAKEYGQLLNDGYQNDEDQELATTDNMNKVISERYYLRFLTYHSYSKPTNVIKNLSSSVAVYLS